MAKFHPLKVSNLFKETEDCSVITFEVPENLKKEFEYKQGQHLTLKAIINNEDVRRSYSLCSSPIENKWQVAVKKIDGGLFSTFVNNTLKVGDTLEVMEPNGTFFKEVDAKAPKNYIVFAAGSGITPILSIIKTHLALEPNCTIKLFYLNKSTKSIMFKEEIESLKNTYFNRFEIFHFLTKESRSIPLYNGRFDKEKLAVITSKILDVKLVDECFLCGPEEMVFLIRDELVAAGLLKDKVHYELFTTSNSVEEIEHVNKVLEHKVEGTEVTIIDGGKEFHFTMTEEFDNVLDGALAAGADLPYACKGGVCSTCRCKIIEGTVEMKMNYALTDREVAKKFVLSCQSVPTSKKIVLDFDV